VAGSVIEELKQRAERRISLSGTERPWVFDSKHAISEGVKEKSKLALVSPMPPSQTGIASYSAALLDELVDYYDVDVITQSPYRHSPDIVASSQVEVRSPKWFLANKRDYSRVIYQFGNSHFHDWQLDLIGKAPGIVVLHDFILEDFYRDMGSSGRYPHAWERESYYSHGYEEIIPFVSPIKLARISRYPMNRSILERAIGIIVHSQYAKQLASEYFGDGASESFAVVPQLRMLPASVDTGKGRSELRREIEVGDDDLLICSFGIVMPTKLSHVILDAFTRLDIGMQKRLHLVLVGGRLDNPYTMELEEKIEHSVYAGWDIQLTGWVDASRYEDYLNAADVAVQLRTDSRGESSRAVLDCLAHGIPTIINAHGPAGEFPADAAVMLFDDFSREDLASALSVLVRDSQLRDGYSKRAIEYIAEVHSPARVGELYHSAVEQFYAHALGTNCGYVLSRIADVALDNPYSDRDLFDVCSAMTWNRVKFAKKQLLVDVSAIADRDPRTGIQRMTRAVLGEFFRCQELSTMRVEPVYATDWCYLYAQKFTCSMLGADGAWAGDSVVDISPGDIFFGLDFVVDKVPSRLNELAEMRRGGIGIYFFVYDILPIIHPEWFSEEAKIAFSKWIEAVYEVADGVICSSRATASTVMDWIEAHGVRSADFKIGYCHLGSYSYSSIPTAGVSAELDEAIDRLSEEMTFLVVGTIEPRKAHSQILSAFEQLWRDGHKINLVFAGKGEWMMGGLIELIKGHPEQGGRFCWFEEVSDEALGRLYRAASCLIAGSYDEGFGLPIVEAARHGIPVIARDIPVFREVAGDGALYFDGMSPVGLSSTIERWLELYKVGEIPSPRGIIQESWSSAASTIAGMLLDQNHPNWLYT
jgi:glycosyltransferase involved in cell wall biosynthesis